MSVFGKLRFKIKQKLKQRKLKKNYIRVWAVTDYFPESKILDINKVKVHTFAPSLEDAKEYINAMIKETYKEHFEAWCQCHDLDSKSIDVWLVYCEVVIGIDTYNEIIMQYPISELRYPASRICMVLRTLTNCKELGCAFEK